MSSYRLVESQVGGDGALGATVSTGRDAHDLNLAWVRGSATASAGVDNGRSSNHGGAEESDVGTHIGDWLGRMKSRKRW